MKISELKPNERNPFSNITEHNSLKLKKSVMEFDKMLKLRPIIYDPEDMKILGGNKRYWALKELGYEDIPDEWLMAADNLTIKEKQRFIIADNINFGDWDYDLLTNDWNIEELEDWGLNIDFDFKQEIDEDEYEISDEIETDIQPGDLFQLGNHRLLCGDVTKIEDIEKLMRNEKADMIFTDPPFDLEDNYSDNLFETAKNDCHIFIMNSDKILIDNIINSRNFFKKIFAVDFVKATLISNKQVMTQIDLIAEFNKGKSKFKNLKDGFTNLIECSKIRKITNNQLIKHEKKIELPAIFIKHYSNENNLIVDLFGGSGSTMAASEQLNRKCYMMEIETKSCQIILDRMKNCYNLISNKL